MKATKITSSKTDKSVSKKILKSVCTEVVARAAKMGFITEAEVQSKTSLRIGLVMTSFRIDTLKIGHNARVTSTTGWNGKKSPKGYKRSNVPTWRQRVEFNNLVNKVFDSAKLNALIISGNYTVRSLEGGAVTSWHEGGDRGSSGWSADASAEIISEYEARRLMGSDDLEAIHKEEQAVNTRERSLAYRAHMASLKDADFLAFQLSHGYDHKRNKSITTLELMTMEEFREFRTKQSSYNRIQFTDCQPAYGETKAAAKNYLRVRARINGAKSEE